LEALFSAVAGTHEAPERQLDAPAGAIGIDEDLPCAHPLGHPVLARTLHGPYAGDQAVVGSVRQSYRLVLAVEGKEGHHGAEYFFLGNARSRVARAEERRRKIVAFGRRIGMDGAAG